MFEDPNGQNFNNNFFPFKNGQISQLLYSLLNTVKNPFP